MARETLAAILAENPIVAAVKDMEDLEKSLESDIRVIFLLFGTICNITELTERIKAAGKLAMVHLDLVEGLASKDIAVDFIHNCTQADGVISTKPNMIRRAKNCGLITIQRFFLLDTLSFLNIERQINAERPDFIELLPGVMPKIISRVTALTPIPIIAGGLVSDKEDVMAALGAGALAVSSSSRQVWFL